jgi:hypothetical protein
VSFAVDELKMPEPQRTRRYTKNTVWHESDACEE